MTMDSPTAPVVERFSTSTFAELLEPARIDLTDIQIQQLVAYGELLFEANASTNLTAVRDIPGIERRLLLESLRLLEPLRMAPLIDQLGNRSLLDIGTGGGLPGMVLAIACPDIDVFLLDATGKKVSFLDVVVRKLELGNVHTIHGRAEEIAHQPRYRSAFDLITARAVSSLAALLELGLPMLRTGGTMLLPKGLEIEDELANAARAASMLNGEIVAASVLPDAGSTVETRLVIARKIGPTPGKYPRRSGVPSKDPLGSSRPTRQQDERMP